MNRIRDESELAAAVKSAAIPGLFKIAQLQYEGPAR